MTHAAPHARTPGRQFKLMCRKVGIKRWPYRKMKSLERLIHVVTDVTDRDVARGAKASLQDWKRQLQSVEVRSRRQTRSHSLERARFWSGFGGREKGAGGTPSDPGQSLTPPRPHR